MRRQKQFSWCRILWFSHAFRVVSWATQTPRRQFCCLRFRAAGFSWCSLLGIVCSILVHHKITALDDQLHRFFFQICRAVRLTGPFVTMIYSMITGDMFTFGIIYLITVLGFSQAFYFLYKGHPQVDSTLFATYPSTWMALFQTTLGDYNVIPQRKDFPRLLTTFRIFFSIVFHVFPSFSQFSQIFPHFLIFS